MRWEGEIRNSSVVGIGPRSWHTLDKSLSYTLALRKERILKLNTEG
jgi:hypothetical protein